MKVSLACRSQKAFCSTVLADDLLGKCQVVLAACALCVVEDGRQTVAWTLAEFDISLDDGFEHQFLEMPFHLVIDLVGQTKAAVVHCQQESLDFQMRIEFALDDFDGVEQLADAFEREILALDGDNHGVGCGKRIDRDEPQRG